MFLGKLLPYQEDAVAHMVAQPRMLVAYDLGLGKTVITIAACERLRELGEIDGPVLVVALASLKYQWSKEITKFSNSTSTVVDGTKAQRHKQYAALDADYIVMNYETVVNDWSFVSQIPVGAVVMDEATAIKSFRSKRSKKMKDLVKQVNVRFALTGTPVENGKPEEIFSIMQAVDSRLLGRFDHFDRIFIVRNQWGAPTRYQNLDVLHRRLANNLIRKTQSDPDVAPYLPDTIHRDPELVPMDRKVRKIYSRVTDELIEDLTDAISSFGAGFSVSAHYGYGDGRGQPGSEAMGPIMARIMILRQLCAYPQLVVESAHRFEENYRRALEEDAPLRSGGSPYALELTREEGVLSALTAAKVPKLTLLEKMVTDHLESDEDAKVVVFSSFLLTADVIADRLGGVVYSGNMDAQEKEAAKVRFQTDPETRVFVSTDAGGYGVDLPQANLLINFDLPWSAGKAVQRNGRIRRASSRWPAVVIQDLLVGTSIEIRQYELLHQKRSVAAAVVDGVGTNSRGGVDFSAGSLLEHLRATV
jgi:SNF2 family DNA or RNA helicase